jgi:hypothetical protein
LEPRLPPGHHGARSLAFAAVFVCSAAVPAQAQTDAGTALQALIQGAQGDPRTQPLLAPAMARLISTEIGTFPVAASSSGFTYTFDPQIGLPVRGVSSFGPSFVERPETVGRGRWAAGLNFQHTNWQAIDGLNLKNGDLGSLDFNAHSFIDLSTTTAVLSVTAGLIDRIDIGLSLPIVHQSVSGHIAAASEFGGNRSIAGISTGIGDMGLRAKMTFARSDDAGLGGLLEIKLPTGNQAHLLGSGKASFRTLLIASGRSGVVTSHVNLGYTFAGSGFPPNTGGFQLSAATSAIQPSNEVDYAGGADVAAGSRLTASVDFIGRSLRNDAQVVAGIPSLTSRARLPILVGVVGAKYNVRAQWLVIVNVLFPLGTNGLKPGVTPVVGLERAF